MDAKQAKQSADEECKAKKTEELKVSKEKKEELN